MNENGKPAEAMSASLGDELLKVLVDKVVNIGTEIGELREQVGRLPGAEVVVAGLEQRIGALEEGLGGYVAGEEGGREEDGGVGEEGVGEGGELVDLCNGYRGVRLES